MSFSSTSVNSLFHLVLALISSVRLYRAACGVAMRILSARPSVCLSNAWIVTKRNKDLSRFLYHTKDHLAKFSEKKNGWWGRPLLPGILGQPPLWSEIADFEPIFARSA